MWTIANLTEAELIQHDGIGNIAAKAIVDFFADSNNKEFLISLSHHGVNLTSKSNTAKTTHNAQSQPFAGLTFVITGTMQTMTRSDMEEFIRSQGGKVSSSVSKKTNYLVAGDNPGSKLEKAETLGVPVINEDALFRLQTNSEENA